jgi:hypothetical protein
MVRMSVAFVSLNDRGGKQHQGKSNQTSWHFEIDSEKSQEVKNPSPGLSRQRIFRTRSPMRQWSQ